MAYFIFCTQCARFNHKVVSVCGFCGHTPEHTPTDAVLKPLTEQPRIDKVEP